MTAAETAPKATPDDVTGVTVDWQHLHLLISGAKCAPLQLQCGDFA